VRNEDFMGRTNCLSKHPIFQSLGSFSHMATCSSSSKNTRKMGLIPLFKWKFTLGPCGAGIGCPRYSWKASGIHSSLNQKKKMESNYFSSYKQPKQRTTNFLFQGNLGVTDSWEIIWIGIHWCNRYAKLEFDATLQDPITWG
jgi:hypothetical protein